MKEHLPGDGAALAHQSLKRDLAPRRPEHDDAAATELLGNLGQAAQAVFDSNFYTSEYPDVAAAGVDPFEHYIKVGRFEKRKASSGFDPARYLAANPEVARSKIE